MVRLDFAFSLPDPERWRDLACHAPLALLVDFDGTLVELASSPEAVVLDRSTLDVMQCLVDDGVLVSVVSGRPRAALEPYRSLVRGAWWIAEHGAWSNTDGEWQGPSAGAPELDTLATTFELLARPAGGWIERKSLSVCLHWRTVPLARRPALVAAAELACEEWLDEHHDFERVPGLELVEVRRRGVQKGLAVKRVRAQLAGVRMIAIGDDLTDEDMFAALAPGDASIAVGPHAQRSRAHAQLAHPNAVTKFLCWLRDARRGITTPLPVGPIVEMRPARERSLVVMSNRTPTSTIGRQREVGGLVSALEPALRDGKGIWLGWSGHEREGSRNLVIDAFARPPRAAFDLTPEWREKFYAGFCNRVLWPLFHGASTRVTYNTEDWQAYEAANAAYAEHALELARTDATIWVHDYHLLLVARELRRRGHHGPLGMFLHIPFPSRDLLDTLPWRADLLDAMLAFDLVGFHTQRWATAFIDAVRDLPGVIVDDQTIRRAGRTTRVGTFPIGIDPAPFSLVTEEAPDVAGLRAALGERRLLLGVDRLDYSKGIPERLVAFERLLEQQPEWRGRVSFVQISVPSRAEIPDYVELKHRVETMVGRINGRYGEADWVPVRYLYRSYDHVVLAQLYRLADIAVVTPLRDGMNLVAKEFIAAQCSEAPGVLVLSRFAGAAAELTDAILTNPLHPDGLAADLDRALRMPQAERIERHARLLAAVQRTTPQSWAREFLSTLVASTATPAAAIAVGSRPIRHFLVDTKPGAKPDRSSSS